MAQADVTYRFRGDSSDLEAAGRQAQAALDATAREATAASTKVGASFDRIADKAGVVGQSAKKLRGALGALSPELANLAGAVDDTADVFEVLGSIGGSVATVAAGLTAGLAALGAAYVAVTVDIERQNEARRDEHRLALTMVDVTRDIQSAQLELAAAYGTLTKAQLKQGMAALAAQSAVMDNAEGHREEVAALRKSIDTADQYRSVLNSLPFSNDGVTNTLVDLAFGVDESRAGLERLTKQEVMYAEKQKELRQLLQEVASATDDSTEANDRRNDSLEKTNSLQEEIQAGLDAQYIAYVNQKKLDEARIERKNAALQAEIDAMDNQRALEEQHAKYREEEELRMQELKAKGAADVIHGLAEVGEAVKDAGKAGFAIWKATALAQIVFDTAVGIQKAVAEFAALPPVAAALGATIAASGAIQAAKIAAEQPVFDMGGVKRTDREMAVVRKGESVLTERGTAAVVDAVNRGDLGGGGGMAGVTVLDHRAYARSIRDEVRLPSTLGRAITGARSTLPGRRPRRAA